MNLPGLGAIRTALGIDTKFPDTRPSELPARYKALRRRRAKNKVARASRKRNRR